MSKAEACVHGIWSGTCDDCMGDVARAFGMQNRPKLATRANDKGGDHYKKPIEPWDYVHANGLGFFEGNVIKYVTRWRDKGGVDDLRKAVHYIEKLIELTEEGLK